MYGTNMYNEESLVWNRKGGDLGAAGHVSQEFKNCLQAINSDCVSKGRNSYDDKLWIRIRIKYFCTHNCACHIVYQLFKMLAL